MLTIKDLEVYDKLLLESSIIRWININTSLHPLKIVTMDNTFNQQMTLETVKDTF